MTTPCPLPTCVKLHCLKCRQHIDLHETGWLTPTVVGPNGKVLQPSFIYHYTCKPLSKKGRRT